MSTHFGPEHIHRYIHVYHRYICVYIYIWVYIRLYSHQTEILESSHEPLLGSHMRIYGISTYIYIYDIIC